MTETEGDLFRPPGPARQFSANTWPSAWLIQLVWPQRREVDVLLFRADSDDTKEEDGALHIPGHGAEEVTAGGRQGKEDITTRRRCGNITLVLHNNRGFYRLNWITIRSFKSVEHSISGGEHQGIVINKEVEEEGEEEPSHLHLEFRVFLVNVQSGKHAQERRLLSFWFKAALATQERPKYAQDFFKQLVSPLQFPRGEFYLKISRFFKKN